jgi:hypothetical protein
MLPNLPFPSQSPQVVRSRFGFLKSLPVGSAVRITLLVRLLADLYLHDRVNLPKREAFRLPGYRVGRVSVDEVQVVVEETAFDQEQFSP